MEPSSWTLKEAKRASVDEEEELRMGPQDLSFPQPRRLAGGIALEIQGESLLGLLQSEGQGQQRVGKTGKGKREEQQRQETQERA